MKLHTKGDVDRHPTGSVSTRGLWHIRKWANAPVAKPDAPQVCALNIPRKIRFDDGSSPVLPTKYLKKTIIAVVAMSLATCDASHSHEAQDQRERALKWTVGSRSRKPKMAGAGAYALLLPVGQLPERRPPRTEACVPATSLLPIESSGEGFRIFLTIDGFLSMLSMNNGASEIPHRLGGLPSNLRLSRLLALRIEGLPRFSILALAYDKQEIDEGLWLVHIEKDTIVGSERFEAQEKGCSSSSPPELETLEAFYRSFDIPRCRGGATRCLIVNEEHGDSHLDLEPHRGDRRENLQNFTNMSIRDAAWAFGSKENVVALLVECP